MYRILLFSLCFLYAIPSCTRKVSSQRSQTSAIPLLKVAGDSTALQIAKLNIDIKVTGNIATTTFDISYYNNTDEILEGEFDFPLADGQNICRYALDIEGKLREGVVVEKAKARIAYESTVRRKVDPGLVEKTKGNNFRTRIYPIPAKGYKRVVIAVEQTLISQEEGLVYKLPLSYERSIKEFGITATVFKATNKPSLQNNTLQHFDFKNQTSGWIADFNATDFLVNNSVEFLLTENSGQVYTEKFEGNIYFYTHIATGTDYHDKQNPSSLTLLWDISASAEKRDIKKETDFLTSYIKRLENVTINLVPFNITTLPAEQFAIKNGDATALLNRLKTFSFDGGTQLGSIDLTKYSEAEAVLFTDGLSTFGKKDIILGVTPVTVVSSSSAPDYSYLKYIALQTHGRFINLNETTTATAVAEISKEPLQFIKATYNADEITDLYTQVNSNLQNGFSLAGILKKSPASVTLHFGFGSTITFSKTVLISDNNTEADNIKRIWASTKIAQLDLEYEKNKAAITKLGKQFSIVTQNTSLLVLDRVEDYLQNDIVPPVELQKEYYSLLEEREKQKKEEKNTVLEETETAMKELKEWYNKKSFSSIVNPIQYSIDTSMTTQYLVGNLSTQRSVAYFSATDSTAVQNNGAAAEQLKVVADGYAQSNAMNLSVADVNAVQFVPPAIVKDEEVKSNALSSDIQLNDWEPETVYLKELQKTVPAKYFEKYLQLKKDYFTQPSFFVDVARFMFEKNDKAHSIQILSNVAEMKLENPELLRIVANQLLEFGETELAAEVFKEVINIREEEPQSYRDLALAYNETGKYQQAVDLLYKLIVDKWDGRFDGVKSIALNEMNAIISAHPNTINVSSIDKKFIQSMPLDVRIVIGWSSNDSDIDLWVTDPAKEKCSYENTVTGAGGKISQDITQGYGPEEFCVKKAKKGSYTIEVNLYGDSRQTLGGPITIKAELFTNFGRPGQKRKTINFRVASDKEVIKIGVLEFSGGS